MRKGGDYSCARVRFCNMPITQTLRRRILVVEDDQALNELLLEILGSSGYAASSVSDGAAALDQINANTFDLVLLDLGLPKVGGLEILQHLQSRTDSPKVIVMTGDHTPETILNVVQGQAYQFIAKPASNARILEAVEQALAGTREVMPIEVVSAKTDWVELLVPCQLENADRIESFMLGLNTKLSQEVREAMGIAFRELLMNAIEWGGKLDPSRKVRIVCIRSDRILLYRIQDPGPGFSPANLQHAAIGNDPGQPYAHMAARSEKGLRPGGFGLMMTRTVVDELIYNEAHNEVVFIKHKQITLSEQEIDKAYAETLRFVSMSRGMISDQTRQRMADAIREFYHLLETRIESKRSLHELAANRSPTTERAPKLRDPGASVASISKPQ